MGLTPESFPTRPRIIADGIAVDTEIDGKMRRIVVTREAFNFYLGVPPAHVSQERAEEAWLKLVQHNLDRLTASAERKLAVTSPRADLIIIGPGEWSDQIRQATS